MKHKHHIVPRHRGGTDDPSNIMEVTIEQHAELHLAEYLTYGKVEDWVAAHALAGMMCKDEILLELSRLGQRRSVAAITPEGRQSRIEKTHTKEANRKRIETMTGKKRGKYNLKVVNPGWGKGTGRKAKPVKFGDKIYKNMKECAKDLGIHLITAYRWRSEGRIQ